MEQISLLEDIKCAATAAQMRQVVELRERRLSRETDEGVPTSRRGKGLGAEIALARRESPQSGSRFLSQAQIMCTDMPNALDSLTRGDMNEFTSTMLVKELVRISPATCQMVDEALADQYGNLGTKKLVDTARAYSNQVDPNAQLARYTKARTERRVTVRPAADGMSFLTALLPTVQAFAAKQALRNAAATTRATGTTNPHPDAHGDTSTQSAGIAAGNGNEPPLFYGTPEQIAQQVRDYAIEHELSVEARTGAQIEADILVERLTGQATADGIGVELHLVMTDTAAFGVSRADIQESLAAQDPNRQDNANGTTGPDGAGNTNDTRRMNGANVEVSRLISNSSNERDTDATPIDPTQASAWVQGLGPLPAAIARDMLHPRHDARSSRHGNPNSNPGAPDTESGAGSGSPGVNHSDYSNSPPEPRHGTDRARVYLRRMLLDPITGDISAMDTRKRVFDGTLRRALIIRDDHCRVPYCGAPIVHLDHTHPYAASGRTSAANGTGLCARCNYTKELAGWKHNLTADSGHLTVTTPTGLTRESTPPPIVPRL